jgi:hypothetical protein
MCQTTATSSPTACALGDDCCANTTNYTGTCEAKGADGGVCPTGGGALDCVGSAGPDGGIEQGECPTGKICCGTLVVNGGKVPNCTASSVKAACASSCGDNPPFGLPGSACTTGNYTVRLCRSKADCAADPGGDTACCSCGTNDAGALNPVYMCLSTLAKSFGCTCL